MKPPLFIIKLNSSCRAVSDSFLIPEYYEWNRQIKDFDSLNRLLKIYEISSQRFKEQVNTEFDNISHVEIPKSLQNIKEIKLDLFLVGWLVVLGFIATLTAKVISWRSVTHMCFLAISHQY